MHPISHHSNEPKHVHFFGRADDAIFRNHVGRSVGSIRYKNSVQNLVFKNFAAPNFLMSRLKSSTSWELNFLPFENRSDGMSNFNFLVCNGKNFTFQNLKIVFPSPQSHLNIAPNSFSKLFERNRPGTASENIALPFFSAWRSIEILL